MIQKWSTLDQIFQCLKRLFILFIPTLIVSIILGMIVSFLALNALIEKLNTFGPIRKFRHGLKRMTLVIAKGLCREAKNLPNN